MITLTSESGRNDFVDDGESAVVTVTFKNGDDPIVKSSLLTIRMLLYHTAYGTILNNRDDVDVLDANGGTVATDGTLTLILNSVTRSCTVDAGTDTFTAATHGLSNGNAIKFRSSGTLPAGIAEPTIYYVVNKTANTFEVSETTGGAAVNVTSAGTGVLRFMAGDNLLIDTAEHETHSIELVWSWSNGSATLYGSEELKFTVRKKATAKLP